MTVVSTTQKLSQDYELISTTYHEAGHAIVGLLNFMKIPAVMVNFTGKRVEGFTHYELFDQIFDNEALQNFSIMSEVYISYAGLIAEKIYYKDICGADKLPMILKEGSSPDILSAAEVISKNNLAAPGKKRAAFKKQVFKELTSQLKVYWDDIRLVAHALYKNKKLYFDDLKILLSQKSKNKKFWKNRFKEIELLINNKISSSKEIQEIVLA